MTLYRLKVHSDMFRMRYLKIIEYVWCLEYVFVKTGNCENYLKKKILFYNLIKVINWLYLISVIKLTIGRLLSSIAKNSIF